MFGKIQVANHHKNNNASSKKQEKHEGQQSNVKKTKPINKMASFNHRNDVGRNPRKSDKEKNNKASKNLEDELKGSKFRILNELLYTSSSDKAVEYFKEHSEDFEIYHQGFRHQATKWSQNPLHSLIAYLKTMQGIDKKVILDLGCGDGLLQQKLSPVASKIRSFDLVAKKSFIQIADIAHLPVAQNSADFCIFCLSLMGTNYLDFLQEARRVLKKNNSELIIAQVQSRSKDWNKFVLMVQSLGFSCFRNKTNSFFRILYFKSDLSKKQQLKIDRNNVNINEFSKQILTSCIYKKR